MKQFNTTPTNNFKYPYLLHEGRGCDPILEYYGFMEFQSHHYSHFHSFITSSLGKWVVSLNQINMRELHAITFNRLSFYQQIWNPVDWLLLCRCELTAPDCNRDTHTFASNGQSGISTILETSLSHSPFHCPTISACPPACPSAHLPACPSACLPACHPPCLPICMSAYVSACLSV